MTAGESVSESGMMVCRLCEWFKFDLPEYLFPATSDVDASIIDTDVIREVCEVCCTVMSNCVD